TCSRDSFYCCPFLSFSFGELSWVKDHLGRQNFCPSELFPSSFWERVRVRGEVTELHPQLYPLRKGAVGRASEKACRDRDDRMLAAVSSVRGMIICVRDTASRDFRTVSRIRDSISRVRDAASRDFGTVSRVRDSVSRDFG